MLMLFQFFCSYLVHLSGVKCFDHEFTRVEWFVYYECMILFIHFLHFFVFHYQGTFLVDINLCVKVSEMCSLKNKLKLMLIDCH